MMIKKSKILPPAFAVVALLVASVADAQAPNQSANVQQIEALSKEADAQVAALAGKNLSDMDLSAAHATLAKALQLPGLTGPEQVNVLRKIGQLYQRADQFKEARDTFEKIKSLDVPDHLKREADRLVADVYAAEGRGQEAIELYRKHKLDLIGLYQKLGDDDARQAECMAVLNNADAPDAQRWSAFTRLPCWDWRSDDTAALRAAVEKFMPAFLEKEPNRALHLMRKFESQGIGKDPAFVRWAAPTLLKAPRLTDQDYRKIKSALLAAAASSGGDALVAEAKSLSSDERLDDEMRLWARLVVAGLGESPEPVAAAVKESVLPAAQTAAAVANAARTILSSGNEPAGRRLEAFYDQTWPRPARAEIVCKYIDDAPFDVGSWIASPLLKDKKSTASLNRPYGDNLKFLLETDSAVMGRNTSAEKDGEGTVERTDFHTACDDDGIHLFLRAHDTRAAEVARGTLGGGSFEMYFAPGAHQAYYTFLADLPKGKIDPQGFITMYENPMFRLPSLENETFRTQTQAVEGGFGLYMFLSWELFYDKLPSNGTRWQFESIRWTRNGGYSFGGSESVHNRSSFGDIVFDGLSPQQLTAIKRTIVFSAVKKYREAKRSTEPVGNWADPVLGDPAFHAAKVAPLLERLDAAVLLVKADMSDADVEKVFSEAVPLWMELPHHVAALRAAYLQDVMLAGE